MGTTTAAAAVTAANVARTGSVKGALNATVFRAMNTVDNHSIC